MNWLIEAQLYTLVNFLHTKSLKILQLAVTLFSLSCYLCYVSVCILIVYRYNICYIVAIQTHFFLFFFFHKPAIATITVRIIMNDPSDIPMIIISFKLSELLPVLSIIYGVYNAVKQFFFKFEQVIIPTSQFPLLHLS